MPRIDNRPKQGVLNAHSHPPQKTMDKFKTPYFYYFRIKDINEERHFDQILCNFYV